jgi:hypothetical protein
MSFEEIKGEVSKLSPKEREELQTLLYALEVANTPEFKRRTAEILDDRRPERWVALDDLDD